MAYMERLGYIIHFSKDRASVMKAWDLSDQVAAARTARCRWCIHTNMNTPKVA